MHAQAPFDARAVANRMLDIADSKGTAPITNLVLQKLLYFAHGHYLARYKTPLVNGVFEAWTYGPVHTSVYNCFKQHGSKPITTRANAIDVMTGSEREIECLQNSDVEAILEKVIDFYSPLSPRQLVDLSHSKDGPWWITVNKSETSMAFGLRITDNLISARFKFHKMTIASLPAPGDVYEDTPLIRE